ncbi:hypothetical protein [Arthrobacter pityocampae]|uniref:hypothetical protein n=1 Tax=Arthrobacter pityocampae TaxID=547334 RepID=UPI0037357222
MELNADRLVLRDYTVDGFVAVHAFASDPWIATYGAPADCRLPLGGRDVDSVR